MFEGISLTQQSCFTHQEPSCLKIENEAVSTKLDKLDYLATIPSNGKDGQSQWVLSCTPPWGPQGSPSVSCCSVFVVRWSSYIILCCTNLSFWGHVCPHNKMLLQLKTRHPSSNSISFSDFCINSLHFCRAPSQRSSCSYFCSMKKKRDKWHVLLPEHNHIWVVNHAVRRLISSSCGNCHSLVQPFVTHFCLPVFNGVTWFAKTFKLVFQARVPLAFPANVLLLLAV